ncbi:hypothetical protein [Streptomyces sp. NPDC004783]
MTDQTPSQAEGERDDEWEPADNPAQTTPSQAEGERDDENGEDVGEGGR